jgi:hypothetical protein
MNLTSSFLALALLGMDDPQPKPDLPPKGSVEIEGKVVAETAPKAAGSDRIHQEIQDLKQIDQAGTDASPPRMKLPRVAKPGSNLSGTRAWTRCSNRLRTSSSVRRNSES